MSEKKRVTKKAKTAITQHIEENTSVIKGPELDEDWRDWLRRAGLTGKRKWDQQIIYFYIEDKTAGKLICAYNPSRTLMSLEETIRQCLLPAREAIHEIANKEGRDFNEVRNTSMQARDEFWRRIAPALQDRLTERLRLRLYHALVEVLDFTRVDVLTDLERKQHEFTPPLINLSNVKDFNKRVQENAAKRKSLAMGIKPGRRARLNKSERAALLARYKELHGLCKAIKDYHDKSYREYMEETRRRNSSFNREQWLEKWRGIGGIMYPHIDSDLIDLFADDDSYLSTISNIALEFLNKEYDFLSRSYMEKQLTQARKEQNGNILE